MIYVSAALVLVAFMAWDVARRLLNQRERTHVAKLSADAEAIHKRLDELRDRMGKAEFAAGQRR